MEPEHLRQRVRTIIDTAEAISGDYDLDLHNGIMRLAAEIENEAIERCAVEVNNHWNDSMMMTNQKDQAYRTMDSLRNLKRVWRTMLAVGNDELGAVIGEYAKCPHCGQSKLVEYGKEVLADGTKVPSKMLGFVNCEKESYLVAIDKKEIK